MDNKYIILGAIGLIFLLLIMSKAPAKTTQDLTICQDYFYQFNLNVAPTTIDFYIGDDLFKTVPSVNKYVSTTLHCGFTYKVFYRSEGYDVLEQTLIVGNAMPINPEVTTIHLNKIGGNN